MRPAFVTGDIRHVRRPADTPAVILAVALISSSFGSRLDPASGLAV
jgi:hypothetical protein